MSKTRVGLGCLVVHAREVAAVLDLDSFLGVRARGLLLPDGIDVGAVNLTGPVPSPAPN
jgi:hypothetical protein